MQTFKTPGGKIIELFYRGFSIKAKFTTGGKLPPELDGSFTSFLNAKTAIEMYLDSLKKKPKEK